MRFGFTGYLLFSIICLTLNSCGVGEDDINQLEAECGSSSLEEIANAGAISDQCKDVLNSLLPEPENNLAGSFFRTGVTVSAESIDLFFINSDESGNPENIDPGSLTITEIRDGIETAIEVASDDISTVDNFLISISTVIDYSASMSDTDVEDAADIYNDFLRLAFFTERVEANHLIFSNSVEQIFDYSGVLEENVSFQQDFERMNTALLDGMGTGLNSLVDRDQPVRILLVTTDGLENASTTFTRDNIVNTANDNNITIVILGSLFSDVSFFKDITERTGGFFIYTKKIKQLRDDLIAVGELIGSGTQKLSIPNNDPDAIIVTHAGKSITYSL